MPLGVFVVVAEGQTNADKVAQLALNKEGVIRGNRHDLGMTVIGFSAGGYFQCQQCGTALRAVILDTECRATLGNAALLGIFLWLCLRLDVGI